MSNEAEKRYIVEREFEHVGYGTASTLSSKTTNRRKNRRRKKKSAWEIP